jgi:hypothetical protein
MNFRQPEFREGAEYEFRDQVLNAATNAIARGLFKTCITCIDFKEAAEHCRAFNARPPARVIAYGCKSYTHTDEIPF